MKRFRKADPRSALALLFFLLAMLSQVRVLFACEFQPGEETTVCCCSGDMSAGCDMGGGCILHEDSNRIQGCCSITIDSVSDTTVAAPSSAAAQVSALEAPQPPPTPAAPVRPGDLILPTFVVPSDHPPSPLGDARAVYLVTHRLRI